MAERGDGGGNGSGGQGLPSSSYTGQGPAEQLAQTLSDLARSLQDEDNLDDMLTGIVAAAVETVPGSQYAGITLVQARAVHVGWRPSRRAVGVRRDPADW
jgi:uncharacterized protein YigA (DUF484 family)